MRDISVRELKARARGAMRGNMLKANYAYLAPVAICAAVAYILFAIAGKTGATSFDMLLRGSFSSAEEQMEYLSAVMNNAATAFSAATILFAFISVGSAMMYMGMYRRRETGYKTLFGYFRKWLTALCAALVIYAANFALLKAAGFATESAPEFESLISLVRILIWWFISLKIEFVYYLLADDMSLGAFGAIKKSWKMASWRVMGKTLLLSLSFIGWAIGVVVTCGALILYAGPYMEFSSIALYECVRKEAENAE